MTDQRNIRVLYICKNEPSCNFEALPDRCNAFLITSILALKISGLVILRYCFSYLVTTAWTAVKFCKLASFRCRFHSWKQEKILVEKDKKSLKV